MQIGEYISEFSFYFYFKVPLKFPCTDLNFAGLAHLHHFEVFLCRRLFVIEPQKFHLHPSSHPALSVITIVSIKRSLLRVHGGYDKASWFLLTFSYLTFTCNISVTNLTKKCDRQRLWIAFIMLCFGGPLTYSVAIFFPSMTLPSVLQPRDFHLEAQSLLSAEPTAGDQERGGPWISVVNELQTWIKSQGGTPFGNLAIELEQHHTLPFVALFSVIRIRQSSGQSLFFTFLSFACFLDSIAL